MMKTQANKTGQVMTGLKEVCMIPFYPRSIEGVFITNDG